MKLSFSILSINNEVIDTIDLDVYLDDSIEQIKYKLSSHVRNKNIKSYYFFYTLQKKLNPYDVYNQLSMNDTILIDNKKLLIFCNNHNIKLTIEKPYYDLDDILFILNKPSYVNIPISVEDNNFIVNPYLNTFNYTFNNSTTSNSLILDYTNLETIYVCFAEDIIDYSKKNNLEIENVFNVYLPYLFQDKLFTKELIQNGENNELYNDYNTMIDFHYKTYNNHLKSVTENKGIFSIYFVLYTKKTFNFPIDILFKLLQSTKMYPYIKLNPKKKQENIYRLYCPNVSLNGSKAPLYDKNKIIKYKNFIKKYETLNYIIEHDSNKILITIDLNGNIYYTISDLKLLNIEELNKIILDTINPLIDKIIKYFDPSEQIFNKFISLENSNVDIIDMKVKYLYDKKKINIHKYIKCFSPIFNLIDEKEVIKLRYKRVSNFNKTDSEQAYLLDLMNLQMPRETIINYFSTAFNVSLEDAEQKLLDIVYLYETKSELNQRKILKSKINPGFPIEIYKTDNNIEVLINNVNNILYLKSLDIYINNLILISQELIKGDEISEICKRIDELKVTEIIEPSKKVNTSVSKNEQPTEEQLDDAFDFDFNFGFNNMPKTVVKNDVSFFKSLAPETEKEDSEDELETNQKLKEDKLDEEKEEEQQESEEESESNEEEEKEESEEESKEFESNEEEQEEESNESESNEEEQEEEEEESKKESQESEEESKEESE